MKDDVHPERGSETTGDTAVELPTTDLPIVALGASAGGLDSLGPFFDNLLSDSGMAFVVAMHLAPDHESLLPEILGRHTKMPVRMVEDGMAPVQDTVYVLPPGPFLSLEAGIFRLREPTAPRGYRYPIDHLFRSLAEDRGATAFGVILSGTGSDGSAGGRAIKERGGFILVEEESSARFSGMPHSAVLAGIADIVAPAWELPAELLDLSRHPAVASQAAGADLERSLEDLLPEICKAIREKAEGDFCEYKPGTLLRRMRGRMAILRIEKPQGYLDYLRSDDTEAALLRRDLLIGVTSFFRDRKAFDVMAGHLEAVLRRRSAQDGPFRLWVPACSTGEEVYSLAILLMEKMEALEQKVPCQIFATDIDVAAVSRARAGIFAKNQLEGVDAGRLERFFHKVGDNYQVVKSIREKIVFAHHDLLRDPPFSKLDLISCRNLLIYLLHPVQNELMSVFHKALAPGGLLFLGTSETVGRRSDLFESLDSRWKIFRSRAVETPQLDRTLVERFSAQPARAPIPPVAAPRSAEEVGRELLLEKFVPPSILVDANLTLVYTFAKVSPWLEPATGKSSNNALEMAAPELRPALRAAVAGALDQSEPRSYTEIPVLLQGKKRLVSVTAHPMRKPEMEGRLALVAFTEKPLPVGTSEETTGQVRRFEGQLQTLQAMLKANMEDAGRSDEVLRDSNEELMTMNEELQVSNEELETSKEELQSLNEELVTVNAELQEKMDELAHSNNDLRNLMNSSRVATIFLDRQMRINRFTPTASALFNLQHSDIGRSIRHLSSNLDYPALEEDVRKVLQDLDESERAVADLRGETHFLVRLLPYRTMEDAVEGVVLTFTDITSRTRMENNLREAKEAAEAASRAKDNFLANMSHELRTPMTVFLGMLELLAATPVSAEQKDYLKKAKGAGESLLRLIEELLDQAAVASGNIKIKESPLHLPPFLEEMVDQYLPQAREKGLYLRLEAAPDLPDLVTTDSHRLRQVLGNLLGNAIKFTHKGSVILRAAPEASNTKQGKRPVRFEIEDTGIGIPPDKLAHIFDRFVQVDSSLRRHYGGVGLGLAISRQIVESMGGVLGVQSEPEKGSLFSFTLPLSLAGTSPASADDDRPATGSREARKRKKPVLVVEDDPMILELIVGILRREGLEAICARNGKEAVEVWEKERPDLVLMDVQMPTMTGLEACSAIRKREIHGAEGEPRTIIVGMTAHARKRDRTSCLDAGMDDYLAKPFAYSSLVGILARHGGK